MILRQYHYVHRLTGQKHKMLEVGQIVNCTFVVFVQNIV